MKVLIRLDDACPTMNHHNWMRMEKLLDQYSVKPIVGVIPDNLDSDFLWDYDDSFWLDSKGAIRRWQRKGWELSMHGLHHLYRERRGSKLFQKSFSQKTEFAGVEYVEQLCMLREGLELLANKGIHVRSFFAPSHTFDYNTVKALKDLNIPIIVDGYAFSAYRKDGIICLPSICDGPFLFPKNPFLLTFVFHPSVMQEKDFNRAEHFFENYRGEIITIDDALMHIKRTQGFSGHLIELGIYALRGLLDHRM